MRKQTMQIRKVKFADGQVTIISSDLGHESKWAADETFTSRDEPQPSFVAALEKLKPHVLDLLELDRTYGDAMTVRGVSFSFDSDDNMGATVTCLRPVAMASAPLVLNTPHVSEREVEGVGASMTREFAAALEHLIGEAEDYVRGVRAQGSLFDGVEEDVAEFAGAA